MVKATILHTEASNGWGGQEIRIFREMLGMRDRGYRMLVATPPGTALASRAGNAGVETFAVSMDRTRMLSGVSFMRRLIREQGVDLINTHSSSDSWIGSIAGRLEGIAVLRTRHISSAVSASLPTRWLYGRLCDEVITTGEFIRSQLIRDLRLSPDRVFSIPTGIAGDAFNGASGARFRGEFEIPETAPVLGIAAVLRSWKGHLDLLDAMASVRELIPDARLLIVGEGPMRQRILSKIRDLGLEGYAILTGYREDIVSVLAAIDVAVMASYASEGIPQFALQAMSAGKPVVATRVGGIPEVVQEGVTGLLVEPRRPDLLAQAVVTLLNDPGARHRMGDRARERASANHSFEGMLDKIEATYRRLLRGREHEEAGFAGS
ncbi:MAG: glycosyltransferase family 4 protein [Syntrophobacteraceae bacterium]